LHIHNELVDGLISGSNNVLIIKDFTLFAAPIVNPNLLYLATTIKHVESNMIYEQVFSLSPKVAKSLSKELDAYLKLDHPSGPDF
jgi:hypothetical protein